jgi:hypothetical protein
MSDQMRQQAKLIREALARKAREDGEAAEESVRLATGRAVDRAIADDVAARKGK